MTRRTLARIRSSAFVREYLADSWRSGLTVVGGIAAGLAVLAFLTFTRYLGELLVLAASQGGHP